MPAASRAAISPVRSGVSSCPVAPTSPSVPAGQPLGFVERHPAAVGAVEIRDQHGNAELTVVEAVARLEVAAHVVSSPGREPPGSAQPRPGRPYAGRGSAGRRPARPARSRDRPWCRGSPRPSRPRPAQVARTTTHRADARRASRERRGRPRRCTSLPREPDRRSARRARTASACLAPSGRARSASRRSHPSMPVGSGRLGRLVPAQQCVQDPRHSVRRPESPDRRRVRIGTEAGATDGAPPARRRARRAVSRPVATGSSERVDEERTGEQASGAAGEDVERVARRGRARRERVDRRLRGALVVAGQRHQAIDAVNTHSSLEQRAGRGAGVPAGRAAGPDVRVREQDLVVAHRRDAQQRVGEPRGAGRCARRRVVDLGLVPARQDSRDDLVRPAVRPSASRLAAARLRIAAREIAGCRGLEGVSKSRDRVEASRRVARQRSTNDRFDGRQAHDVVLARRD